MKNKLLILLIGFAFVGCNQASKETELQEKPKAIFIIAYNQLVNQDISDYDVFTMNMDGSSKMNITDTSSVDWLYHASGKNLYFISTRDSDNGEDKLYSCNAKGNNITQITDFSVGISWLSTQQGSNNLVVCREIDGNSDLYLLDSNGTQIKRLTHFIGVDRDPSFSNDGKHIAFRAYTIECDNIWMIKADGSDITQITNYDYPPKNENKKWRTAAPQFSPDNDWITFPKHEVDHSVLVAVDTAGQNEKIMIESDLDIGWHSWSPDGEYIVFNAKDTTTGWQNIYLYGVGSKKVVALTNDSLLQMAPVFIEM